MSLATVTASPPASAPATGSRGIPPLPLLTLLNFFNYMDRQVVYGMTDKIMETFQINHAEFGWLAFVNLIVFALASAISGPIADRIGPRKVIFTGVAIWSAATPSGGMSSRVGRAITEQRWARSRLAAT